MGYSRLHTASAALRLPGTGRTSGTASLGTSPEGPQALADRFRTRGSQGEDTPIERSVQRLRFLASGRADALSGRYSHAQDQKEALVRRAAEMQREDLRILTWRTEPQRGSEAPAICLLPTKTPPNQGLELTAYSVRSCLAVRRNSSNCIPDESG